MDESLQKKILNELKTIKKLMAQNVLAGFSQTDQIDKLDTLVLEPKEISELLGTTANTVSVALNRIRKTTKKKRNNS